MRKVQQPTVARYSSIHKKDLRIISFDSGLSQIVQQRGRLEAAREAARAAFHQKPQIVQNFALKIENRIQLGAPPFFSLLTFPLFITVSSLLY